MSVENLFVTLSAAKLRQSVARIEVCLGKLTDDQIWQRGHETENAVGNLVLHLAGNVRQWVISGLGGEPDNRIREREFSTRSGIPAAELAALLRDVIQQAATVIESLTADQLTHVYRIQDREPSGVEAVMSVVEHFGQHTGQIIYATKNLTGQDLKLMSPGPKK
ncbi:MAG: DUF1572 domain-containing protein [Acidobacteriota bacterium]|nr:DUF1572 domain-containing protein [Acidobacteriota bacterium]